jgi:hypothetical protein
MHAIVGKDTGGMIPPHQGCSLLGVRRMLKHFTVPNENVFLSSFVITEA